MPHPIAVQQPADPPPHPHQPQNHPTLVAPPSQRKDGVRIDHDGRRWSQTNPSPQPHPQGRTNHLLTRAHALARQNFQCHVQSVLQHAAVTCLRRVLSRRVRVHLQQLSREQLTNDKLSTEELLMSVGPTNPNPMKVSEEDIEQCYRLAKRVGNKWAEVLRRQGYHEFAEVALDAVRRGGFLDRSAIPSSADDASMEQDAEAKHDKYASPYTALHQLRRYPPDCDGSGGLPSGYLPVLDGDREAIRQIDQMAYNDGETTSWQYGWDAIEEAVARNRKRIDNFRMDATSGGGDYGIVPRTSAPSSLKSSDNEQDDDHVEMDGNEGEDGIKLLRHSKKRGRSSERRKSVQFKGDTVKGDSPEGRVADIDPLLSTNKKASSIMKRPRRGQEMAQRTESANGDHGLDNDEVNDRNEEEADNGERSKIRERGRPASSIGEGALGWDDDVLTCMTAEERRKLILSAIHPPYPFESEMKQEGETMDDEGGNKQPAKVALDDQPQHSAVICGALKEIGHTHLWEQTRHFHSTVDDDDDGEGADENEDAQEQKQHVSEGIILGASEARATFQSQQIARLKKRALARATKERLGRRTESIEHKPEYARLVKCSKVRWTEENIIAEGAKENLVMESRMSSSDPLSSLPPHRYEMSDQQQRLKWILGNARLNWQRMARKRQK